MMMMMMMMILVVVDEVLHLHLHWKSKNVSRCEKKTMVTGENTLLIIRLGMNAFRPEID